MVLVDAEKKGSDMALVDAEKKDSEMALVGAEKKGSDMALVGAEKKGSEMALVGAEKKGSDMALVDAEKKGSDMALVGAEKKSSDMALVGAEKKSSDMALVDAEKDLVVAEKSSKKALVVGEKGSKKALVEPDWDQLHQDLMAKLSFAPKKDPVVADEELSMRALELTVEELDLLQQAAIDLASLKTKEAAEFASAAACFKAAKDSSSYIREPEPTKEPISTGDDDLDLAVALQGCEFGPALIRRLFKATPSQMRAAHKTASRVLKIDEKNIGSVSADVYRQVLRSTAEGQKEVPLHDVTRVLQAFSKVENNLPKGVKVELLKEKSKVEMMKAYADNINRVAGVCGAAKSTYEVLRDYFF